MEWKRLVHIFYGHLENIAAVLLILWPFGSLVSMFWYSVSRNIRHPWLEHIYYKGVEVSPGQPVLFP
jgi:hypothetical protein